MKATIALVASAASVVLASAQPHGHQHFHKAKRASTVTVSTPAQTAYAFVLDGTTISRDQVCSGIADGSLKFDGVAPAGLCSAAASISVPATSSTAAAAEFFEQSTSTPTSTSTSTPPTSTSSAAPVAAKASSAVAAVSSIVSDITGFAMFTVENALGTYPDFEDGVHDCSDGPPTIYGAVPVSWVTTGGWAGVQQVADGGATLLGTGNSCEEGNMCQYACVPGFQMAQWPTTQPAGGQSVGGVLCQGGKLYKTNGNPKLCSQGSGDVTVQNKGGSGISICRTAYPGTESETCPVWVPAASTQPLTSPEESEYYVHLGSSTSAEYYVNPFGVAPNVACSWNGAGDGNSGNDAPIVFGVGYKDGTNWLSIQQDTPMSYNAFEGTIEIVGSSCSGVCKYSDGQYCLNGEQCAPHTQTGAGCTVSCSGPATFVISQ